MQGKKYDELTYAESNAIKRDCLCAQCWGPLTTDFERGATRKKYKAFCHKCGEGRGFVTRKYAEQRRAESYAEANEAARNLGKILGVEEDKQLTKDAIKALYQ